jgi:hypothetical protein
MPPACAMAALEIVARCREQICPQQRGHSSWLVI